MIDVDTQRFAAARERGAAESGAHRGASGREPGIPASNERSN